MTSRDGGTVVDQLATLVDAIVQEFGSTVDGLSQDGDLRRFFARQLALRGAWVGPVPAPVPELLPGPVVLCTVAITPAGDLACLDTEGRLWLGVVSTTAVQWTEIERPEAAGPATPPGPPAPSGPQQEAVR